MTGLHTVSVVSNGSLSSGYIHLAVDDEGDIGAIFDKLKSCPYEKGSYEATVWGADNSVTTTNEIQDRNVDSCNGNEGIQFRVNSIHFPYVTQNLAMIMTQGYCSVNQQQYASELVSSLDYNWKDE